MEAILSALTLIFLPITALVKPLLDWPLVRILFVFIFFVTAMDSMSTNVDAKELDINTRLDLEYNHFFQPATFAIQDDNVWSAALEMAFVKQWQSAKTYQTQTGKPRQTLVYDSVVFTPFARVDGSDDKRSHGDIRELLWVHAEQQIDWRIGIGKTFWGATEFFHLADSINQTDWVESVLGDEKLGQPLLSMGYQGIYNRVDFWVLPGFRPRTFPGREGRLQFSPLFNHDTKVYASDRQEQHIDLAWRWSMSLSNADLGLSYFGGTRRDPLIVQNRAATATQLVAFYDQQRQLSVDLQWTLGSWLLKLEGIGGEGRNFDTVGSATGVEYSLVGIGNTTMDLALVAEYLNYSKGWQSHNFFRKALAVGARLSINDSAGSNLLVGYINAENEAGGVWTLQYRQRLNQNWSVSAEGVVLTDLQPQSALSALHRDDYLRITLQRYF